MAFWKCRKLRSLVRWCLKKDLNVSLMRAKAVVDQRKFVLRSNDWKDANKVLYKKRLTSKDPNIIINVRHENLHADIYFAEDE